MNISSKRVMIGLSLLGSILTFSGNANSALYPIDKNTPSQSNSLALNSSIMQQEIDAKRESESEKTNPDFITRLTALASVTMNKFQQIGVASWYGRQFNDRSGEMTAIHPSLPINCRVKITNKNTGESVVARIVDHKKLPNNRVIDLSYNAAKSLGLINAPASSQVLIERIK